MDGKLMRKLVRRNSNEGAQDQKPTAGLPKTAKLKGRPDCDSLEDNPWCEHATHAPWNRMDCQAACDAVQ